MNEEIFQRTIKGVKELGSPWRVNVKLKSAVELTHVWQLQKLSPDGHVLYSGRNHVKKRVRFTFAEVQDYRATKPDQKPKKVDDSMARYLKNEFGTTE